MYVTTFYSYKGGVGRTMALANVATDFVRQGRRVLLVDFDLEAPGLDTFKQLKPSRPTPGIVEYVSDYLTQHEAPNVADYVYEVSLPARTSDQAGRSDSERAIIQSDTVDEKEPTESRGTGRLWIMPAGRRDASYSSLLQAIDWASLYAQHDGYLMFEDLKEQWRQNYSPDYVLIDSRTGHTDVAGICTRQLPDAVVLFFFPNDQNLRGLEGIVKDIRDEADAPRNRHVALHFVMSNVPDLDDEDRILRDRRADFRRRLKFRRLSVIHHYNSLALLNQSIFCEERPRSRLAHEYRSVGREVISQNPEDREGALQFLKQYLDEGPRGVPLGDAEKMLEHIAEKHSDDGDIQTQLAFLRMEDGKTDRAKDILEKAIKLNVRSPGTLVRRAQCRRLLLSDREGAASDASLALKFAAIEDVDAFKAVRMLGELKATDLLRELASPSGSGHLSPQVRFILASELADAKDLTSALAVLRSIQVDPRTDDSLREHTPHQLILALIGGGEFQEAMRTICPDSSKLDQLNIQELFNYAMANWGAVGQPDKNLFDAVARLDSQGLATDSVNYAECMAVVHYVLGNTKTADQFVDRAESLIDDDGLELSCWRYLRVDAGTFRNDLASMRAMIGGSKARPLFLDRGDSAELVHTD